MPAAARITDVHVCPAHGGGPVIMGEPTVLIGFQPAARIGDKLICSGPPDAITEGEPTVLIGNKDAARFGDATQHGGKVAGGCPSVIIGSSPQSEALMTDLPFCEECEKARREEEEAARSSA